MDKWHGRFAFLFSVPLLALYQWQRGFDAGEWATFIGFLMLGVSKAPDLDHKVRFTKHRNAWFHSGLLVLPLFFALGRPISLLFIQASHLGGDIKLKKRGGTYCVSLFGKRLNYEASTAWLAGWSMGLVVLPWLI